MAENKKVKKYELTVDMIPKVSSKVFDLLKPENVDLESFKNFEDEVLKLGNVIDPMQLEAYANKSKIILTKCKNFGAVVFAFFRESERRVKRAKAKVLLVESEEKWAEKQADVEKPKALTDTLRKAYVDDSDAVNDEIKLSIKWEALNSWFINTYKDLENYHNWYKKLFDRTCQKGDV